MSLASHLATHTEEEDTRLRGQTPKLTFFVSAVNVVSSLAPSAGTEAAREITMMLQTMS